MKHSSKLFSHTENAPMEYIGVFSYISYNLLQGELKVVFCIVVRDIFDDLGEGIVICRELPVFYPVAYQIAQDTSEILMSGVGQKASGICQHTYKAGQVSKVGKRDHLILHAGLMIVEPPSAALLNLSNGCRILEAAEDCADGLVVIRI